jgi:hypothetical protein
MAPARAHTHAFTPPPPHTHKRWQCTYWRAFLLLGRKVNLDGVPQHVNDTCARCDDVPLSKGFLHRLTREGVGEVAHLGASSAPTALELLHSCAQVSEGLLHLATVQLRRRISQQNLDSEYDDNTDMRE